VLKGAPDPHRPPERADPLHALDRGLAKAPLAVGGGLCRGAGRIFRHTWPSMRRCNGCWATAAIGDRSSAGC